jgi:hypothetical protein
LEGMNESRTSSTDWTSLNLRLLGERRGINEEKPEDGDSQSSLQLRGDLWHFSLREEDAVRERRETLFCYLRLALSGCLLLLLLFFFGFVIGPAGPGGGGGCGRKPTSQHGHSAACPAARPDALRRHATVSARQFAVALAAETLHRLWWG